MVENLSTKTTPGPDGLTDKFYQIFKKEIILNLYKIFQKTKKEEIIY